MSCYCLGMQWCQMPTACACFLDAILKLQTVGSKLLAANHQRSNTRGTCHPWSTYLTCTSARATLWFCRESHEKITFDTPTSHIARCRRTHPPISSCVPSTWHEICLIHTPIAHLLYCGTTCYEHVSLQSTPRKSPYNMLTQSDPSICCIFVWPLKALKLQDLPYLEPGTWTQATGKCFSLVSLLLSLSPQV